MTIVVVTIVMTLVQVVALGTLPGLATSKTPLADASLLFMGGAGAALITPGRRVLDDGQQHGAGAVGIAKPVRARGAGDLPRVFGWVHPRSARR